MATLLGAMPHYGPVHPRSAQVFFAHATRLHRWIPSTAGTSLLAHGFNTLWVGMRLTFEQLKPDYFVMVHADVIPELAFGDKLVAEMEWTGADVISVVLPIKSSEGLTSTAIDDPETEWEPHRRLTTSEVQKLPETFSIEDCGYTDGRALLLNTGLMIVDLSKPWIADFPGFEIRDRIRMKDGRPQAVVAPEDWNFSRWLNQRGAKLLATRKVQADHVGDYRFPNQLVWGDEFDAHYVRNHGQHALPALNGHAQAGDSGGAQPDREPALRANGAGLAPGGANAGDVMAGEPAAGLADRGRGVAAVGVGTR